MPGKNPGRAAISAGDDAQRKRVAALRRAGPEEPSCHGAARCDAGAVKAAHKDGVLTITLPKTAEAKPKPINITAE